MKVLIVASNNQDKFAPFILEQSEALKKQGITYEYLGIKGKSVKGYLKNLTPFKNKIKEFQPDLIHAHYGLSGLFANLQRKIPVITTYHGSDIHNIFVYPMSFVSMFLSKQNIFVSKNRRIVFIKKASVIPCGIDLDVFFPRVKEESQKKVDLNQNMKYVLFSSSFSNTVKNYPLAEKVIANFNNVELLEFKGYNRILSSYLFNAVDAVLMTSFSEGSPQFIKEAVACGCPVVTVPVGDVKEILKDYEYGRICSYQPEQLISAIRELLAVNLQKSKPSQSFIGKYDNKIIAQRIINVYKSVLSS